MKLYVLDDNNNKIEVTTEVLTALVEQIKCCVSGTPFKLAFVTQAKYNELKATGQETINTLYFITDDSTAEDIDEQLEKLKDILNNKLAVPTASKAYNANKLAPTINEFNFNKTDPSVEIELEWGATYVFQFGYRDFTTVTLTIPTKADYDAMYPSTGSTGIVVWSTVGHLMYLTTNTYAHGADVILQYAKAANSNGSLLRLFWRGMTNNLDTWVNDDNLNNDLTVRYYRVA